MNAIEPNASAAVIDAMKRGNKIEAIKLARQESGMGLKEAKDFVEAYLVSHPEVQAAYAARRAEGTNGGGFFSWLSIGIAVAFALYWFFGRDS